MQQLFIVLSQYPKLFLIAFCFLILIPLLRVLISHYFGSRMVGLKKIELVNDILSRDLNRPSKKQRFLTEQAFSVMYNFKIDYDEIKALLHYKKPSKAFRLFKKAHKYLEISRSGKSMVLKSNYCKLGKSIFTFYPLNLWYSLIYFVNASLASLFFLPCWLIYKSGDWFDRDFILQNWFWAAMSFLVAMIFIVLALKSLWSVGTIKYAFELVEEEN